jgi:hypothetical protein
VKSIIVAGFSKALPGESCNLTVCKPWTATIWMLMLLTDQLRQLSGQSSLPLDLMVVIGGGIMQWSMEEHQKCLRLHSAYSSEVQRGQLGTSSKPSDILNLAAALVRQNLPSSHRIIATEWHAHGSQLDVQRLLTLEPFFESSFFTIFPPRTHSCCVLLVQLFLVLHAVHL